MVTRRGVLWLGLVVAWSATAAPARADAPEVCATTAEHALEHQESARYVTALEEYQACAVDSCPRIVREDCRKGIQEVKRRAPRLFVRVRDAAGADVLDAEVTLDGQRVSVEERTRGRLVDPGVHAVKVGGKAAAKVERSVMVTAGDRERTVEVVLEPVQVTPPGPSSPPPAPAPTRPLPERKTSRDPTLALVVGGLGVSVLAASGIVGANALSEYRGLETRCGSACSPDEVASVDKKIVVTDVLIGTGIVALGAALVLWLTAPERAR